jgi:hypothetical protein
VDAGVWRRLIFAQLVLFWFLFPENSSRGEEILETDLFSLDAVNPDILTFISVLPGKVLPSLVSTLSNTTYQPENSSISHASFISSSEGLVAITENPIAKNETHSHPQMILGTFAAFCGKYTSVGNGQKITSVSS